LLSARAIGRRLRVPSGAVRRRIVKWTKSGFLKGSVLVLNPEVFNLQMGMLTLDASPPSPREISSIGSGCLVTSL
jgi:DNA-binding Lrp family transcriptional regulator